MLISHADHAQLVDLGMTSAQKGFLGALGVYVFFILSGYLIWTSAKGLDQPGGLRNYAMHRVTRLVPLYVVNVAFAMWALPYLEYAFATNPSSYVLLRHLTFTQDFAPQVSRDLNPVLWTLTHEAVFYVLVPLLTLLPLRMIPLLGFGAYLLAMIGAPLSPFLAVFYLFTIGILLAEGKAGWALLAAAAFSLARASHLPWAQAALVPAAVAIVMGGLLLPARALWLTAPLKWVGVISFSLYIWHYVLIGLMGTLTGVRALYAITGGATADATVRGLIVIAIMLAFSALSYWLIERPSMTTLRRYLVGQRLKAVAVG